ncbi:MAG: deoxynucleoside kinase [Bacteroidetes bacterium MED-G17]|jgi:deoxyadenosine/deoxycytidine kinase|nr:MAG: deoxynucleoside kinase [Bacteroidetes bacterium MED-G17]|tara:strand:- start:9117 stop:9740 length:624 start_codon:yes stop_codon:yes gene_type:complete
MKAKHIAIAGNIGSGKTTLTTLLSKHYDWEPHYEALDENPYISDFYEDMPRWSFNLQIYFLNSRFNSLLRIAETSKTVVQDRTIFEDSKIFAPNLHSMGLMTTRDFETYESLFTSIKSMIQAPDLMVYLRGSIPTLVSRIQKRGREYEDSIRLDYLKRLNERYEAWITKYDEGPLLIIDVDDIDFESNPEDLGDVIKKIDAQLHGLF